MPASVWYIISAVTEYCLNTKHFFWNMHDKISVQFGKIWPVFPKIKILKKIAIFFEIRGFWIIGNQCIKMFALPLRARGCYFIDGLSNAAVSWYCYPLNSAGCWDPVAVAPVVFCKLNFIVEDKFIYIMNDIKISLPRDIIWLSVAACDREAQKMNSISNGKTWFGASTKMAG